MPRDNPPSAASVQNSKIEKDTQSFIDLVKASPASAVDFGCADNGELGTMLARKFPSCRIHIVADNMKCAQAAEKSALSYLLSNVSVHVDDTLQCLKGEMADLIVMKPSSYEGKQVIHSKMKEAWRHLRVGGHFFVLTHMRRGAPSLIKMMEEIYRNAEITGKGGGGIRIVRSTKRVTELDSLPDEQANNTIEVAILGHRYIFVTEQSLFSRERIDKGTLLLIESVDVADAQTILDLGCGYGVIGIVTATSHPSSKVFLVDVDAQAIRAARLNAQLNKCERNTQILVSDGLRGVTGITFDLVLSHFPLHIPKEDQIRLLSEACDALMPGGRLCLVALTAYDLRFLMKRLFGNVTTIADTSYKEDSSERYRVLSSTKEGWIS